VDRRLEFHIDSVDAKGGTGSVARALDRITVSSEIMNGQPCIRGMRLTVRRVVEAAARYSSRQEIKAEYPELEDDDVAQAIEFAARNLGDEVIDLASP
jgi:uncharacterized protein (DUF433 family)